MCTFLCKHAEVGEICQENRSSTVQKLVCCHMWSKAACCKLSAVHTHSIAMLCAKGRLHRTTELAKTRLGARECEVAHWEPEFECMYTCYNGVWHCFRGLATCRLSLTEHLPATKNSRRSCAAVRKTSAAFSQRLFVKGKGTGLESWRAVNKTVTTECCCTSPPEPSLSVAVCLLQ